MPEPKNKKSKALSVISDERIIGKIYHIRGEKVMFDRDLAELYGVSGNKSIESSRQTKYKKISG